MKESEGNLEKLAKNKEITKASFRGLEDSYTPHAGYGVERQFFTKEGGIDMETLYSTVKSCPEILGAILAIVEDIIADGWKIEGSKTSKKAVGDFLANSNFYKVLTNALFDLLVTGNSYILKLSVSDEDLKSLFTALTRSLSRELSINKKIRKAQVLIQTLDKPKDLQVLKSSTIKINYDETGNIVSYEQNVRGERRIFKEADIIHLSLINIGGEPYGFTPLEPLLSDAATLILAKNYVGKYFENEGLPDFLFNMPEDNPDSRNYKLLKEELKKYKKQENKRGSMVLTGNVGVQQIQKFNKDMEFYNLIQHFTQIILIALGVPSYRINFTISERQQGSQVNRAFEGYYKKIAFLQKLSEGVLNKYLFGAWKATLKFNQAYKIDELREAQIVQILSQTGSISTIEARRLMGFEDEMEGEPINSIGDEMAINFNREQRRDEGRDNNAPPTDQNIDNKLKFKSYSYIDIKLEEFIKIVEGYVGEGGFNKAKVLYKETDNYFELFFDDGNWKYRSLVNKTDIDVEAFRYERLLNAIKIL